VLLKRWLKSLGADGILSDANVCQIEACFDAKLVSPDHTPTCDLQLEHLLSSCITNFEGLQAMQLFSYCHQTCDHYLAEFAEVDDIWPSSMPTVNKLMLVTATVFCLSYIFTDHSSTHASRRFAAVLHLTVNVQDKATAEVLASQAASQLLEEQAVAEVADKAAAKKTKQLKQKQAKQLQQRPSAEILSMAEPSQAAAQTDE